MEKMTRRVDRQATSLLDMTFWSNLVVILLIIILNIVNLIRSGLMLASNSTIASPQLVILVSLALIVYMGYICYSALMTKQRLKNVIISVDDAGVTGFSLPNPTMNVPGEAFSIGYNQIRSISIEGVAITKKHTALSLKIETDEQVYIVPAPTGINELAQAIEERFPVKEENIIM